MTPEEKFQIEIEIEKSEVKRSSVQEPCEDHLSDIYSQGDSKIELSSSQPVTLHLSLSIVGASATTNTESSSTDSIDDSSELSIRTARSYIAWNHDATI